MPRLLTAIIYGLVGLLAALVVVLLITTSSGLLTPYVDLLSFWGLIAWGFTFTSIVFAFSRKSWRIIVDVSMVTLAALGIVAWLLFPNHPYVHTLFDIRVVGPLSGFGFTAAALSLRHHIGQLLAQPSWKGRAKLAATYLAPCFVVSLLVADMLSQKAWERHDSALTRRASFAQNHQIDRVSCARLGLAGDGIPDGVVTVDWRGNGVQSGLLRLLLARDAELRNMRLERSSPPGVWEASSAKLILGVSTDVAGPLVNAPDGSIYLPAKNSMRLWAFFCRDGHDAASSTYHLVVGDRRLPIEFGGTRQTLALAYGGQLADKVGQGDLALAGDGVLDGTFTVTLGVGSGARAVTSLQLERAAGGVWDTVEGNGLWALGAASTVSGALVNAVNSSVNFAVADGGSFNIFASDNNGVLFAPGNGFTLTASFADGSTATATATVP